MLFDKEKLKAISDEALNSAIEDRLIQCTESNMQEVLIETMKSYKLVSMCKKNSFKSSKPWLDQQSRDKKRELRGIIRQYRIDSSVTNRTNLAKINVDYSKMIASKKSAYYEMNMCKLRNANNTAVFWKYLAEFRKSGQNLVRISGQRWYEHFVTIFNPTGRESIDFSVGEMSQDEIRPLTQMELKRALNRMRHKTAPGPDLIPCSLLKRLSNTNQAQ